MQRKDRMRLWIVLIVIVAALVYVWPIRGRVNLGLDLKGGAHIVLQAKGTPENPVEDSIDRLLFVLRNRIDQYGVAEPIIQRSGEDRVIIDLPGVQDPSAALELIGKTALLEFREVLDTQNNGAADDFIIPAEPVRSNYPDKTDEEFAEVKARWQQLADEIKAKKEQGLTTKSFQAFEQRARDIEGAIVAKDESNGTVYLLGKTLLTGKDLATAGTSSEYGKVGVSLSFTSEGATLFEEATARLLQKQIAIVLDGVVISAPVVQSRIAGGQAQITGNFSIDQAQRLSIMLRAGALPVKVEVAENRSVGPSLGADSIRQGIEAGLIGAALVFVFMLLYYRFNGLAANVALAVTMLLVFAGLIAFKATLTLPGIAGIILTIGMAVDGNVLIYERMKEELRAGKTPVAALDAGFRKALVTILDSNITTLIAAVVLFYFGSGSVRGFGVTLSIGLIASVFSNVVVTRALLQLFIGGKKHALKRS